MCGIAGVVSFSEAPAESPQVLSEMASCLRHRGPDASGAWRSEQDHFAVGLAHTRLSIIDLSAAANQPMTSVSGRSVIVFNGEIYNYSELRDVLGAAGARFRTRSDTEVLLAGYEAWGMDGLLARLDGMFAFALVDLRDQVVHLARDPFGKKPCYYWHDPGRPRLAFGSDPRSFRPLGGPRELDLHALGYYFAELATPERHGIWREVKKLPGGHHLRFGRDGLSEARYWGLRYSPDNGMDWNDAVSAVGSALRTAVRKRLVGDVPCAALLSGGVDSSLVVAEMAKASSRPVRTYTVGFENSPFDERSQARVVAERFGTDHTELVVRARDLMNERRLLLEFGEPFADFSALPTYLIARSVAAREKVVLTGDGGDELFAGYYVYYFASKLDLVRRFGSLAPAARVLSRAWPSYRTRFLARLLEAARQPGHRLLRRNYGFSPGEIARLLPVAGAGEAAAALDREHEAVWRRECEGYDRILTRVLAGCLYTRLAADHLVKVDRATMYASLEARAPLLDRGLAVLAASLRPDQLLHGGQPKAILKALAVRDLPADLVMAEKRGFAVPVADWLRGELKSEFEQRVLEGRQRLLPMDYDFVLQVWQAHQDGTDHAHRLWSLYAFHVWAQEQHSP
jgi:asparagine synthase (glutamine-hydrolysing)